MTDSVTVTKEAAVDASIAALEVRVTELENVVHALAPYNRNAEHPGVIAWLGKVGARIKSAVEKVV